MGRSKAPKRPMQGFSKICFDDDGEATAVCCQICGAQQCFCDRGLDSCKLKPSEVNVVGSAAPSVATAIETSADRMGLVIKRLLEGGPMKVGKLRRKVQKETGVEEKPTKKVRCQFARPRLTLTLLQEMKQACPRLRTKVPLCELFLTC